MNDAARDLVGRTLGGRFRLTGFLGEGAMASVYRAEQDAEPKHVAIKIMHPELLVDATFAKRFTREAKAVASIEHRNSVRILEHGTDGKLLYLAMELLTGQDLFDVLARERRLPEARAARIVGQICRALEAAHARGIIHRDLKPENVMIERDPDDPAADLVKVLDFGIAKIVERPRPADDAPPSSSGPMSAPPSSVLTRVGAIVGTPDYMPPEQCTGMPVDARSDVYSCGVLLFLMVTGKPPFSGGSAIDVIVQHIDKPPPAPSALLPTIHPGLEKVILQALAKAPENRQQTARALAEQLDALLPELAVGSRRATGKAAATPPGPASTPKASELPGKPEGVVISADKGPRGAKIESDEPPQTMRSTAGPADEQAADEKLDIVVISATQAARTTLEEEERAEAAPDEKKARAKPDAMAKTLSEREKPDATLEREPEEEEPSEKPEAPTEIAKVESRAANADAPRSGAIRTRAAQPAPSRHEEWPPWVFVVAVAILGALIWLGRYLRFG